MAFVTSQRQDSVAELKCILQLFSHNRKTIESVIARKTLKLEFNHVAKYYFGFIFSRFYRGSILTSSQNSESMRYRVVPRNMKGGVGRRNLKRFSRPQMSCIH